MKKIIIGTGIFLFMASQAYAITSPTSSEVGGTISTGVDTGINFTLPCNPVSVSHGTVNAQTCAITCTSPYILSGNSCVAPVSS